MTWKVKEVLIHNAVITLYGTEKIKLVNGQMTDARGDYPQASEFKLIPVVRIP